MLLFKLVLRKLTYLYNFYLLLLECFIFTNYLHVLYDKMS